MADLDDGLRHTIETLRQEVERLRDWRHDEAVPQLLSALADIKDLRGRLKAEGRKVDALELRVERMARADEVAAAVTNALHKEHGLILTRAQKLGAVAGGLVLFAVSLVDFIRTLIG